MHPARYTLLPTLLLLCLAGSPRASDLEASESPGAQLETHPEPKLPENPPPMTEVYRLAKQASVEVLVNDRLAGTGWFVDAEGLLVTAAHVVQTPDVRIEVHSPSVGRIGAKVEAISMGDDVAVLRVDPREGGYPAFPLAKKSPPVGEEIFVFGTPLFVHYIMLRGMVAADQPRFIHYPFGYVEAYCVAVTLQGGTSGGAWFDRSGRVVGLQSGSMGSNSVHLCVAYVVPVEKIRALLESGRHAKTPKLDMRLNEIWTQAPELIKRFPTGSEGLAIESVGKDGPAERAGLKPSDLITVIDDQPLRYVDELLRIVRAKRPGDTIKLTVEGPDGTGTREATLRLGEQEVAWPDE